MPELLLLPIFLVWFCMAFPVLALIVGFLVSCTALVLRDVALGAEGEVWCPIHERRMHVKGTPRRFRVGVPFSALRRCERYGPYRIRCAKDCLARGAPERPVVRSVPDPLRQGLPGPRSA